MKNEDLESEIERVFRNQRRRCLRKSETVVRRSVRRRRAARGASETTHVDTYSIVGLSPQMRRLDEYDGEAQE